MLISRVVSLRNTQVLKRNEETDLVLRMSFELSLLGRVLFYGSLLASTACLGHPTDEEPEPIEANIRVLMIGNSHTFWHNLPEAIAVLIDSVGEGPAYVTDISVGGWGLEDHWMNGAAKQGIYQQEWDVVVLQQGASATTGRPSLLGYSALFAEDIVAVGARPAMYMVWPYYDRQFDFDGVTESYTMAAEEIDGMLFPVGEAWRATWRRDSTIVLYDVDGVHASITAAYLAALVIMEGLTGVSPIGAPSWVELANGSYVGAPDSIAAILQEAAAEANANFALPR